MLEAACREVSRNMAMGGSIGPSIDSRPRCWHCEIAFPHELACTDVDRSPLKSSWSQPCKLQKSAEWFLEDSLARRFLVLAGRWRGQSRASKQSPRYSLPLLAVVIASPIRCLLTSCNYCSSSGVHRLWFPPAVSYFLHDDGPRMMQANSVLSSHQKEGEGVPGPMRSQPRTCCTAGRDCLYPGAVHQRYWPRSWWPKPREWEVHARRRAAPCFAPCACNSASGARPRSRAAKGLGGSQGGNAAPRRRREKPMSHKKRGFPTCLAVII